MKFLDQVIALELLKHYALVFEKLKNKEASECLLETLTKTDLFSYDEETKELFCRGESITINSNFSTLGGIK